MKNLKKLRVLGISVLILAMFSCSLDPVIGSKVTNFPVMSLIGPETVFVPLGTTYNDPGIIATESGASIAYTSKSTGKYRNATTLNTNIADEYVQTYTAVNKDGFSNSITRKVIVYKTGDLVNSIEGVYISTVRRNGSLLSASQGSSVDMKYVYIWKNADGTFEISDAFGGWYDIGRKIGLASATQGGTITGNIPTNAFTFPGNPLTNVYFGGVAALTAVTVNPTTKTVIVNCDWDAGPYKFVSTLTQVQL
ncbi:MAG: immunoglobulin-like domain-containing protein [Flavobacterium sp.]